MLNPKLLGAAGMCQGGASAYALFRHFSLGTWVELLCSSSCNRPGMGF